MGAVTAGPANALEALLEAADRNSARLFELLGIEPSPTRTPTVRPTVCEWCGGPIQVARTGRPALFCSDAHRLRAWRAARGL